MSECRCGRPLRDNAACCDHCVWTLEKALGDVAALDEELEVTITRQRGIPTEGGSASRETSLPWHEKASDARRNLKALLVSWTRLCAEERLTARRLPDDNLASIARWLLWVLPALGRHDAGPDAVDEITDAVAECRRVIDKAPERWYAGPCDCGADLYAKRRTGIVACRECEVQYDVEERRDWLLGEAEDRLANAATIARAVSWLGAEPLTSATVRKWAQRGRLLAKGHDGRGPLYRIGDAIDLMASEAS